MDSLDEKFHQNFMGFGKRKVKFLAMELTAGG